MRQHNRLRKATDLASMHLQSSVSKSCQRRLEIIELVLAGDNTAAAEKLTALLENDMRVMKRSYGDVMKMSRAEWEKLVNAK